MIELLKEECLFGDLPTEKIEQVPELRALKEFAKQLSRRGRVHCWWGEAEIKVESCSEGFAENTTFKGTSREMNVLSNMAVYLVHADRLARPSKFKLEIGDMFINASVTERAVIQQLKKALPMFTRPDGRFALCVVLTLGITEEHDLTAASRLSLDDLFAVIEFMQETGKSLAQVAEELTT